MKAERGETVALVGMSGGGKSTLVSLIPRFYDVSAGRLVIDGIDVRDYQARSLRNQIGMVLQDMFLFSESVRENISIGNPEASMEDIIEAAKAANAHDFIMDCRKAMIQRSEKGESSCPEAKNSGYQSPGCS